MRRAMVVALGLTLGAASLPARAWHVPPPLAFSVPFTGGVALSLEAEVPEDSRVLVEVEFFDEVDQFAVSHSGYHGGYSLWGWAGTTNRVHVTTHATGPVVEYRNPYIEVPSTKGTWGMGEVIGQSLVYAAMSDPKAQGEWRIFADPDATVTLVASGEAGLVGDAGFGSRTRIEADPAAQAPTSARVHLDGSASIDIEHNLFGWFDSGTGRAGYDSPAGSFTTTFEEFFGDRPGRYDFWIDSSIGEGSLWLVWADIPTPAGWAILR